MFVTLPPELEVKAKQLASRSGLSLEGWLEKMINREAKANISLPRSLQDELTPEEWVRQFQAWSAGHDRTTPLLTDQDISRESIYPDRI